MIWPNARPPIKVMVASKIADDLFMDAFLVVASFGAPDSTNEPAHSKYLHLTANAARVFVLPAVLRFCRRNRNLVRKARDYRGKVGGDGVHLQSMHGAPHVHEALRVVLKEA